RQSAVVIPLTGRRQRVAQGGHPDLERHRRRGGGPGVGGGGARFRMLEPAAARDRPRAGVPSIGGVRSDLRVGRRCATAGRRCPLRVVRPGGATGGRGRTTGGGAARGGARRGPPVGGGGGGDLLRGAGRLGVAAVLAGLGRCARGR